MAYIDFHPTIHAMGDEACAAALIEGTLTEFVDMALASINGFRAIDSLTKVHLPNVGSCDSWSMMEHDALVDVKIPKCGHLYNQAFENNPAIKQMIFGISCNFAMNAFKDCSSLEALVLAGRRISKLSTVGDLAGTSIANGTGYIYVPKKMVNIPDSIAAYEAATNWSAFARQYRYIEDYPEILAKVKEVAPWY